MNGSNTHENADNAVNPANRSLAGAADSGGTAAVRPQQPSQPEQRPGGKKISEQVNQRQGLPKKSLGLAPTDEDFLRMLDAKLHRLSNRGSCVNYDKYLSLFYRDIAGEIKQNHIFSCNIDHCWNGNKLIMDIYQSDLPDSKHIKHNMMKQNFYGRKTVKKIEDAIKARPQLIRAARVDNKLVQLTPPGINPYTQVELHDKFGPCLSPEDAAITCPKPPPEVYEAVKNEGKNRKQFKLDLMEEKQKVNAVLTKIAEGELGCEEDYVEEKQEGQLC